MEFQLNLDTKVMGDFQVRRLPLLTSCPFSYCRPLALGHLAFGPLGQPGKHRILSQTDSICCGA